MSVGKLSQLKALEHKSKLTPEVMERIEAIVANKPEGPRRYG